jgi:hypothetical protein
MLLFIGTLRFSAGRPLSEGESEPEELSEGVSVDFEGRARMSSVSSKILNRTSSSNSGCCPPLCDKRDLVRTIN